MDGVGGIFCGRKKKFFFWIHFFEKIFFSAQKLRISAFF